MLGDSDDALLCDRVVLSGESGADELGRDVRITVLLDQLHDVVLETDVSLQVNIVGMLGIERRNNN